jgi:hypothetical protein
MIEKMNPTPSFQGLRSQQLLNPTGATDRSTFRIWYGPAMEYQEEGVWGLVPRWTPLPRFDEVGKLRRIIQVEKMLSTPSCLEENGAKRGVIRYDNSSFQQRSPLVRIKSGKEYWAPVIFNRYHDKESNETVLTFSVVTRQVSSYELKTHHPLQVPIELPDPLSWLDPALSKFKIDSFFHKILS